MPAHASSGSAATGDQRSANDAGAQPDVAVDLEREEERAVHERERRAPRPRPAAPTSPGRRRRRRPGCRRRRPAGPGWSRPSAAPMPRAAISEPPVMTRVHVASQASVWCECRHSKATARMIRPNSTSTNGRYSAGSQVAYQPGKAANTAPTAVISQTSLPSQSGPMLRSMRCRSAVRRPSTGSSAATPKSKPSSSRKPVHSTATAANQRVCRSMSGLLCLSRRTRGRRRRARGRRRRPSVGRRPRGRGAVAGGDAGADEADDQPQLDDGQRAVDRRRGRSARSRPRRR